MEEECKRGLESLFVLSIDSWLVTAMGSATI